LGIKVHTEVFDSGDLVRGEHLCYSGKIFLRSFWSLLLLLMQMLIAGDTLALEININFVLSGWRDSLLSLKYLHTFWNSEFTFSTKFSRLSSSAARNKIQTIHGTNSRRFHYLISELIWNQNTSGELKSKHLGESRWNETPSGVK
jgi:hypothetical protein